MDRNLSKCDDLAPNLGTQINDCRLIFLREETGGSMGFDHVYGIFAIADLPNSGMSMVPLKFFDKENDALNFIDPRK